MRRAVLLMLSAGALAGVGCQMNRTKKFNMSQPKVMEYNLPPNEPRYNNPPEDSYKKPPISKDLASQPGGGGLAPALMNPNGLGGQ